MSASGARGAGRGSKKGGRKGKQRGGADTPIRDLPTGQMAFFGRSAAGSGDMLEDDSLEGDGESSPNYARMVFDPTEALDLLEERWQDCITYENIEVVPSNPNKTVVNPKFNVIKEMTKILQQIRPDYVPDESLE